jgi:hypothetical protein
MLGAAQYKLARGSHAPDNPDEDVCLVEAAIIAAGFERRGVGRAQDCPACFSRVLAQYAILLNDAMPDDLRNELLLPFVTRLAGTADRASAEATRAAFIAVRTVNTILPSMLQRMPRYFTTARQCQSVTNIREIQSVLFPIRSSATRTDPDAKPIHCLINATFQLRICPVISANSSGHAARWASEEVLSPRAVWAIATDILYGAINLGNSRPPESMPVRTASMTNPKPTALVARVPSELSQADRELEFA